jgi:hypothetical protein
MHLGLNTYLSYMKEQDTQHKIFQDESGKMGCAKCFYKLHNSLVLLE